MTYRIGIDTGGTFTDAVLINNNAEILYQAKSLTTHHDLAQGIDASIGKLPKELMAAVTMVSLSTTLTTNSVVEGKGAPVCILLAGYEASQIKASGLIEMLGKDSIVALTGGFDASGNELAPLDVETAQQAIISQTPRVSAFAISSTFAIRNPAHELQLRKLVHTLSDKPTTCGHELASALGAPRRALTAALNARMIPFIKHLIEAVETIMQAHHIKARLMIVKGDGSLSNTAFALKNPVTTVLSGPAASVLGACALAKVANAIIADMGGTTTDIAVVRQGQTALCPEGAWIGQWQPMVETVKVFAVGLGGDSQVHFSGGDGICIGPRRVVPMSLLATLYPNILEVLKRQQTETPHPSQMRFALPLAAHEGMLHQLGDDEHYAWEQVQQHPVDVEAANANNRLLARALARLERKGLVIYSGFTPSDAVHVLGIANHWHHEAAELAARIWARQMRHLYGYGKWHLDDAQAPAQTVFNKVIAMISKKLIEAGLFDAGQLTPGHIGKMAQLLTELCLQRDSDQTTVFQTRFAAAIPLVAVGAPAVNYYPQVTKNLGVALITPQHAEVANAYGAVIGKISERAQITIVQHSRGIFRVFTLDGPRDFQELASALLFAEQQCRALAQAKAQALGAANIEVHICHDRNQVDNDIDGSVFFEAKVEAIASAVPTEATLCTCIKLGA